LKSFIYPFRGIIVGIFSNTGLAQGAKIRGCITLRSYAKRQILRRILVLPPQKTGGAFLAPPIQSNSSLIIHKNTLDNVF